MQQTLARLSAPPNDGMESDDLCLRQTPALWVWRIVSRLTRQVLSFAIGDHMDALLEGAWACVPAEYRDTPVCTDPWGAYDRFFPPSQHSVCDKGSGKTSIMEGLNTKWRQRQSGMVRRACGVHPNSTDDICERFVLLLDTHNRLCEQRWESRTNTRTTQLSP